MTERLRQKDRETERQRERDRTSHQVEIQLSPTLILTILLNIRGFVAMRAQTENVVGLESSKGLNKKCRGFGELL